MADDGFTAFFQSAYLRVVGKLRLLTGDQASAEDVAQEAFIRAAARWRQLAHYDQPEAWCGRPRSGSPSTCCGGPGGTGGRWPVPALGGSRPPSSSPRTVPSSRRCCGCPCRYGRCWSCTTASTERHVRP
ncbi:MAG TPA: sigma factor [Actinomycetes bacterium]|nr:sigma factor [Actinomycetes bacterium]